MLLERIADYAIKEQTSKLPHDVIHHAKRAVIDWYAALLPGSRVAPAILLEQAFAEDLDRGRARLATGRRATLRAAALINGAASHSVEFDDIYRDAGYHPGSPVISAALAAAQATGANGETIPARRDRRLRSLHAHRRSRHAFALQVLAHDRNGRLLRRRSGRGDDPRLHARAVHARARHRRHVRLGPAAGVPLAGDDASRCTADTRPTRARWRRWPQRKA